MIARIWRGRTRESDQNTYFEYLQRTGLKDYASTSGNRGVWVLRRVYEGKAEFTLISLWDSWDAIKAFISAFLRWKPTSGSPWFPPTWLVLRDAPVPLS